MSYCRFSASSDVYVFPTTGEGDEDAIVCCQCSLSGQWFRVKTPSEMIEHLNAHLKAGHRVPSKAFDRLRQEASAIESARVALSRGAEPETLRCLITRNPVGTDTRPVGNPCPCANCSRVPPRGDDGTAKALKQEQKHEG